MALIISSKGNSAFRSEELEGVFHLVNDKTHRLSNKVGINFKSGNQVIITCKTSNEAKILKDTIINAIKYDKTFNELPSKRRNTQIESLL